MAAEEYIVYRAADQKWGLQYMGRSLATFPNKAQAIRAGVSIAHAKQGRAVLLSSSAKAQTAGPTPSGILGQTASYRPVGDGTASKGCNT